YSIRYKNYREAILSIFPFIVIYRINKKKKIVFIISVFHSKRNPKRKYLK
ncbi:MAG: type II toxin-antitoxin system RelE/ParE family toxin, partial [Bacteroidetes bacterium]|nr:type II toxin-antitoxin system RelE/ParE family toxin [Bacteroidota bacterium]